MTRHPSTGWICSERFKTAPQPLTVAPRKGVRLSFGNDVTPTPPVPMVVGVSSIHSAVTRPDAYRSVVVKVSPRVSSSSVMRHGKRPGVSSEMLACIRSCGLIAMSGMVTAGAGMSSHQAD